MRLSALRHRSRFAFTLVETIVVFVIIAMLAAIGAIAYNSVTDNAKLRAAQAELAQFEKSAQALAVLDGRSTYTQADFDTAVTDQPAQATGLPGAAGVVLAAPGWLPAFGASFPGDGKTIAGGFTGAPTPATQLSMASWVPGVGCAFSTGTPGGAITTWAKKGLSQADCVPANATRDPANGGVLLTAPPTPQWKSVSNGNGTTTVSVPGAPAGTNCDFYVSGVYAATAGCQTGWTDPNGASDGGNYTVTQHPAGDTSTSQTGWKDSDGSTALPVPPGGGSDTGGAGPVDATAPVTTPTTITWNPGSVPAGDVVTVVVYPPGGGAGTVVPGAESIDPATGWIAVTPPSGGGSYQVVAHDPSAGWNDPGSVPLPVTTAPTQTPPEPSGDAGSTGGTGGSGGAPPAASVSGTDITLTWNAVASTPTAPLTGYRVYSATTSAGTFVQAVQLDATTTTWTDHVGSNSTQVCYTLTAYGPGGESPQSQSVCATTIAAVVAPGLPTNVAVSSASGQATATWDAPASGGAPTNYVLFWVIGSNHYTDNLDLATTHTVTGLTDGVPVCFYVEATNSGGQSATTPQVCATPIGTPAAPTTLAVNASGSNLALTWTAVTNSAAAPVAGYRIYRAVTASGPFTNVYATSATNGFTDDSLTAGTQYCYTVAAYGPAGQGPSTTPTCVISPAALNQGGGNLALVAGYPTGYTFNNQIAGIAAFDAQGNAYLTDWYFASPSSTASRVIKVTPDGTASLYTQRAGSPSAIPRLNNLQFIGGTLYAVDNTMNTNLAVYKITAGSVTALSSPPIAHGSAPSNVVSDGTYMYVVSNGKLYQFTPGLSTSTVISTGLSTSAPSYLTYLNGAIWVGNGTSVYSVNLQTGAVTPAGNVGSTINSLTTDGSVVYASVTSSAGWQQIVAFDPATAKSTLVAGNGTSGATVAGPATATGLSFPIIGFNNGKLQLFSGSQYAQIS